MKRWSRNGRAGLLVGCWVGLAGAVSAGPCVNIMQPCDCPPTHYSVFHILTPVYYRWIAWCQGPKNYTFARMLNPDIATTSYIKKYHCPSVNPFQFAVQNYVGLNGTPPSSTHQSPSETGQTPKEPQKQQEKPPQEELPSPREDKTPEKLPPPREEPDKE